MRTPASSVKHCLHKSILFLFIFYFTLLNSQYTSRKPVARRPRGHTQAITKQDLLKCRWLTRFYTHGQVPSTHTMHARPWSQRRTGCRAVAVSL